MKKINKDFMEDFYFFHKNKFLKDMRDRIPHERVPYFWYTKALWKLIAISKYELDAQVLPGYEPDFASGSNSQYYYTDRGVYRLSNHYNHWVASCDWTLSDSREWLLFSGGNDHSETPHWRSYLAFAKWEDFKSIPYDKRNLFYYFRDRMDNRKQGLAVEAGLVKKIPYNFNYETKSYDCYNEFNCSYEELKEFSRSC